MRMCPLLLVGIVLLAGAASWAAAGDAFPFVMPWDDASRTVIDVSALNPAPLDPTRRISIKGEHFYDQTGRRVRFMGVNLAAGACFPTKADAPRIAARMHKLGINCVRLHHMDSGWAQPNLFALTGGSYDKPTDRLDPQSLDRLDYLVYQLKQHGIYVDVNLHVGRGFTPRDGLPDTDRIDGMGKVVGYFEPTTIARQKLFARQLLTHVNPYTKTRFVDDPVVALIEITNEDSLLSSVDTLPALPPHYRGLLAAGWNRFLKTKYGSTRKLLTAWNAEAEPLGQNVLRNPRFENGTEGWFLEQHENTHAEVTAEPVPAAPHAPPGKALRLGRLQLDGTGWHLQFHQLNLTLQDGQLYTLSFAARSEAPRTVDVNVRLDQDPWTNVGLDTRAALTPEWQRFRFSFRARGPAAGHTRLSFTFGDNASDVLLADVSLQPGGGNVELPAGASLEAGTLPLPTLVDSPQGRDYAAYLIAAERDFSQGMRSYLKGTLGAKPPVTCTQASYGGIGGVWRESHMDWVDMHAYWQHPWFPNRPWDSEDYRIGNTALVRNAGGGTLAELARYRVAGKPFTVSEYDHPAPSEYAAEMVPMIFTYAAWQDWDGVFLFAYHGDAKGWDRDHIDGFFDQSAHPGKLAFLPAAAQIFLRGGLPPAPGTEELLVPEGAVPALVARREEYRFWRDGGREVPAAELIGRRVAVRFVKGGALRIARKEAAPEQRGGPSLSWEPGRFTAWSPEVRVAVGFFGKAPLENTLWVSLPDLPRDFAAITVTSLDGRPIGISKSLLVTAVDKVENQGLEWNAERTFAGHAWTSGPTLAQVPPATLGIPINSPRPVVYALDATGRRTQQVPLLEPAGNRLRFTLDPKYHALWYEIHAE